jgi:purine nucleoside permease
MLIVTILVLLAAVAPASAGSPVIRPRVVVLVFFEVGNDTGDRPGELQYWVERDHLTRVIDVPGMSHHVRANADGTEIAVAVGPGQIRPAINVTALGNDPRFDLRASFWLITGIAGTSPHDASLGSAFWTDYVVNGELVHAIDPREMPRAWPDGIFALDAAAPEARRTAPRGSADDVAHWPANGARIDARGTVVRMNPALLRWAYDATKSVPLPWTQAMRAAERTYRHDAAAQSAPAVRIGAQLATEAFWHGARLDAWAHRWVRFMTADRARYATTGENDSGAMVALYQLTLAKRADWNRALLLRTASNFEMQPDGMSAAQSLAAQQHGAFPAYLPALESAYAVGEVVVRRLLHDPAAAIAAARNA